MNKNQGHVEIHLNAKVEHYVKEVAENGEVLRISEGFSSGKNTALKSIVSVMQLYNGTHVKVRDYSESPTREFVIIEGSDPDVLTQTVAKLKAGTRVVVTNGDIKAIDWNESEGDKGKPVQPREFDGNEETGYEPK